ncbi:helix-turn-helix domain-containing protein [Desertivirga brevis]|uniref:helix-turn-helix domain-containing protein n=1 Tax=Desertivirga brevis TaxID=2810310 RepID=UPI001A979376|nr:helix-turn-helix domain-containing protein [Pedobacter sp. SYSU D00873]
MHENTRISKLIYAIRSDVESVRNDIHILIELFKQYFPLLPFGSPKTEKELWITARAAGELINVDRKTIEAYARDGKIRKDKINGLWHYLESDVLKYDKRTEEQKRKGR